MEIISQFLAKFTSMFNIITMLLLISLLILVHELGHFFAARMCGIRVTRFGFGMPLGPSWKLFKIGHTTFYLHAFLFGGYVSFADDEEQFKDSEKKEENIQEEELLPKDSPELYENKTIGQKLFVVSAGVLMNIVFAIFLVILTATCFGKLPTSTQNISIKSFTSTPVSNVEKLGFKSGDKFVSINNQKIETQYQLVFFVKNSKLFDDYIDNGLVDENLKELQKLNPKVGEIVKKGQKVFLPLMKPESALEVNRNVLKGLEKYENKNYKLSECLKLIRNEIHNKKYYIPKEDIALRDIAIVLSDTYKPMEITVLRGDKEITFKDVRVGKEGLLGVLLNIDDIYAQTKTPKQIISKSFDYLYSTTSMMLFSLWQLFTGKVSASDMHGVIAVVKVGGDVIAQKGLLNGLLLTAMISINLAIMNFLPIPALDGGHVMFLLIEKITGKKPSKEFSEKLTNFFFFLLIILMVCICYNDIYALVTKKL